MNLLVQRQRHEVQDRKAAEQERRADVLEALARDRSARKKAVSASVFAKASFPINSVDLLAKVWETVVFLWKLLWKLALAKSLIMMPPIVTGWMDG